MVNMVIEDVKTHVASAGGSLLQEYLPWSRADLVDTVTFTLFEVVLALEQSQTQLSTDAISIPLCELHCYHSSIK